MEEINKTPKNDDDDSNSMAVNVDDNINEENTEQGNNQDNDVEEDDDDDDGETVHTSLEDPILGMLISDKHLNVFDHQIVIDFVLHSAVKPKIEKIFPNRKRLYIQISKNNIVEETVNIFKNDIDPKYKYAVYFKDFYTRNIKKHF
uniref:Uncharacterized protein LOC114340294 n=1 Tax=Diabrotica virgifera virgifera TaxID=50390 RepID=A0A6P7GSP2_DIAVI